MKLRFRIIFLMIIANAFFCKSALSYSMNWSYACSIHWDDVIPDIMQGAQVSPLDLMESDHQVDITTHVWCYNDVNDVNNAGQHIGAIAQSQTTPGNNLALRSLDPQHQDSTIPFEACLGLRSQEANVCLQNLNSHVEYDWGDGQKPSLVPEFLMPLKDGDPTDPEGSHGLLGKYNYIAHVHLYIDRDKIVTPPVPGDYEDSVKVLFNGNVSSGISFFMAPDQLDITADNNPLLQVYAHFVSACRIDSSPDVILNGSFSSDMSAVQNIGITCTNGTPFNVTFTSANQNGNVFTMLSADKTKQIHYGIFSDSNFSTPWQSTKNFTGTGKLETIPVYYKTNSNQENQPSGQYTDIVTLTVTY
ncbi:spore coat U domain-containing protein [Pantoea rodasii]|nr:spore coat U domain-containing protein [Pantoea rodasii]